ncbi:hypothetical protein CLAFUW4_04184 [Fulvia fulva]|uniref:SprT-like domain-containing protein n=1 Tax=Passalora fulva TaxID=5499 RepID=A0A9Q8P894_PASFU|nr:uncharacterized protein CLAFUR5_04147 [Fulvia fulva]KAK4626635.1 hypothetical protein CLAFUR4_04170 [Fulvia fulva]KAK4627558.1 hypothetical protein CLAFUR0_04171 [Fulvia fulva]UJO16873.1 hypothetical protein CLAFUR5_04147 [Fulvia fulva]WPV14309.1 hypothetical protein CLAFUW4_04184 [Fulvia fulva]WPV28283.1 hypothetical protein CLAFUW7_04173 [Fulvia fulva]
MIHYFNEDDIAVLQAAWNYIQAQANIKAANAGAQVDLTKERQDLCNVESLAKEVKHRNVVQQQPQHRHARWLRSGQGWRLFEHHVLEVTATAIASFTGPQCTKDQSMALAAWPSWFSSWKGPEAGVAPIMQAIEIFNHLFFLGKLQNMHFLWREGLRARGDALTSGPGTDGYTQRVSNQQILIVMDPEPDFTFDRTWQDDLLSTLLHECCHAFIDLYRCHKHEGHHACRNEGKTGHGAAWFHLASEVKVAARSHLRLDAELGVLTSVVGECRCNPSISASDWEHFEMRFSAQDKDRMVRQMKRKRSNPDELLTIYQQDSRACDSIRRILDPRKGWNS